MKASVLTGNCVARDAVSEAVRGSLAALRDNLGAEVKLYTEVSDFDDFPTLICRQPGELMLDKHFASSDIILYHFGFHFPMFGMLALGNGHGKQMVRFHNVTPKAFMPSSAHPALDRSMRQLALIDLADAVLADSEFNAATLSNNNVSTARMEVSPLYVRFHRPAMKRPPGDGPRPVHMLFVGRIVPSKGAVDLVEAAGRLAAECGAPFRLTLVGNLDHSNPDYLQDIRTRIVAFGLEDRIAIMSSVTDEALEALYADADLIVIPSYHEGFCLPVLEGLQAGCVPLTSDAGNLPSLVKDLGAIFPAGDVEALTESMRDMIGQFAQGRPQSIRLGGRTRSWEAYHQDVKALLGLFSYETYAKRTADAARRLLSQPDPPRASRPDLYLPPAAS